VGSEAWPAKTASMAILTVLLLKITVCLVLLVKCKHVIGLQVEVQTVPGQGRGLFATEKICKGQQLLQIPDALLLTADKAAEECCIGSALKDAGMFDWTVLATYLVELWDQQKQGHASSYWAEYVALLPDNTGCILEWTAKEVWDQDAVL